MREIYRRVANVQHPDHWLPVSVVCPNCGKVGTTIAVGLGRRDGGRRVPPRPRRLGASAAAGPGRVSPFGGAAKLPWNLEWAAQWSLFGVTIEPNGKDLATAGGSRDRSNAIAREVFEREPPLNFPYEFLNIAGRKMSTSKGLGAAAHTFTEIVPPEQTRFLFVRPRPESAIDFDPEGTDAVPRLFDEFDRLGAATAGREVKGELPAGLRLDLPLLAARPGGRRGRRRPARSGRRSRTSRCSSRSPAWTSRARVAAEKGSALTDAEAAELEVRLAAVRRWLEAYAPERARIEIRRDALPVEADQLRPEQRGYLRALAEVAHGDAPATGEQWQAAIFAVAADHGLDAKAAFMALYLAFLGRPNGPRAGWLLASLDRDFVIGRLREAGEHRGRRWHERRRAAAPRGAGPDPPGRDRQGRGPGASSTGRSRSTRRGAGCRPSRTRSRPSATRRRSRSARRSAAARSPDGPEVAELRARLHARRRADRRHRRRARGRRGRARGPAAAHPEPRRPRRPGRRRGGERHRPHLGRAGARTRRPAPTASTWTRRPHWELGEALDIIDNVRGAKVAGSGFPVYKGAGSRLQRALISWFLDVHTREHGLTEIWPPVVVNAASARGTGQIPDKEDQMYVVTRDDLYLVPTAEVPVTNLHRDEILEAAELPIRYAAYSPCFRREAGRGRQGHPRHPARPPVRQGRDGAVREARRQRRRRSSG